MGFRGKDVTKYAHYVRTTSYSLRSYRRRNDLSPPKIASRLSWAYRGRKDSRCITHSITYEGALRTIEVHYEWTTH